MLLIAPQLHPITILNTIQLLTESLKLLYDLFTTLVKFYKTPEWRSFQ